VTLAILELLEQNETLDSATIDAFIETNGSPIVEGPTMTFLFRGKVDAVRLRHFIFGLPTSQAFRHIGGTDLWYLSMEVPRGSRIEYKLEVDLHGVTRLIRDPLNKKLANDPYGANSVCFGTGYHTPDWTKHDPEAREGTLEDISLHSDAFGGERTAQVYLPARMRTTRRYPVMICFDGADYLRFAHMKTVLDNLIHRYEISPMIVVLTQSGNRMAEYAADERNARFVAEELVPFVEKKYPARGRPKDRGLMGASLGAVASFYTAWRYPGMFGDLLLQSGSFAFTDIGKSQKSPILEPVVKFVNEFRADPGKPVDRIFVSCGTYESLIYENRSLVPLLQTTGMDVKYVEARDGHNWENWRDRLREGLSWLFPGPIGLVYE
jgi:enterochelin esterase family protein